MKGERLRPEHRTLRDCFVIIAIVRENVPTQQPSTTFSLMITIATCDSRFERQLTQYRCLRSKFTPA
jgi:hypothetical protein